MKTLSKIAILFGLGYTFGLTFDYLLQSHTLVRHPQSFSKHLPPETWISLSFGFASCFIGLVYPLFDIIFGIKFHTDWTKVLRCYGAFAGFNYAIPRFYETTSNIPLLICLSIGLWFAFDRTTHGGLIALLIAFVGTNVSASLVDQGFYSFENSDFMGMPIWMPLILYSVSVCFGLLGRQLNSMHSISSVSSL